MRNASLLRHEIVDAVFSITRSTLCGERIYPEDSTALGASMARLGIELYEK
jgi:hypothetical protein